MTRPSFTPIALRLSAMCACMGYVTYRHSNETALLFVVIFYLVAMSVWAGVYAARSLAVSVPTTQPAHPTTYPDADDEQAVWLQARTSHADDDEHANLMSLAHDRFFEELRDSLAQDKAASDDYYYNYYSDPHGDSDGIDMNVVDGFGRFYGHDYDYQD